MSYKPYYAGGWQSGESGGTPITPEALRNFDNGIISAYRAGQPRNILDNSYFPMPVVQRRGSFSNYENKYTVDRWKTWGKVENANGGIKFTNISPSSGANNLYQYFEVGTIEAGKAYTAAMMLIDGTLCVGSGTAKSGATSKIFASSDKRYGMQIAANYDGADHFAIRNESPGVELDIAWVALYEGEYSAETLPKYQPKGYVHELMECMRYFQIYEVHIAALPGNTSGGVEYPIMLPVPMRVTPTVNEQTIPSDVELDVFSERSFVMRVNVATSGVGVIRAELSADL